MLSGLPQRCEGCTPRSRRPTWLAKVRLRTGRSAAFAGWVAARGQLGGACLSSYGREYHESAICRRPHPRHRVVLPSGDGIDGRHKLVTSDDFQGHLPDPPSLVRRGVDDGCGGAVVPGVEEPPCRPHAGPVAAQPARSTRQDLLRRRTAESEEETGITRTPIEEPQATRNHRLLPPATTLSLNALAWGHAPDARPPDARHVRSIAPRQLLRILLGPSVRPPAAILHRYRLRVDERLEDCVAEARRDPIFELRQLAAAGRDA